MSPFAAPDAEPGPAAPGPRRRPSAAASAWAVAGLLATGRLSRWVRVTVVLGAVAGLIGLGALDRMTGAGAALTVVYLIPPVLGGAFDGGPSGVVLSAASAAVWAVARPARVAEVPVPVMAADAALRFVAVSLVVLLVVALKSALERAVESDRRARDFVALAAHQMRTPVTGMRASAEALIAMGSTPAQERLLANLAVDSRRVGRLVNALLWVDRVDQGGPLPAQPTDVADVCREEADRVAGRVPWIEVEVDVGPDLEGTPVTVNVAAWREITANLLDNAHRHARSRIDVRLARDGDHFELAVRDDGPGLPVGAEERAFQRFVSLDGSGGSGLGLALSRGLAGQMGGSLGYERGCFTLRLPVTGPSPSNSRRSAGARSDAASTRSSSPAARP